MTYLRLQGYRQHRVYIATQTPMENTVDDFWRMIWEYQSRSIVVLCRMVEDGQVYIHTLTRTDTCINYVLTCLQEQCHAYLPGSKGSSKTYGKVTVKLVSQETSTDFIIRHLELSQDIPRSRISNTCLIRVVTVFHYLCWPKHVRNTSQGTAALLEFMEYINRSQMSSGNKPITVMCKWVYILTL